MAYFADIAAAAQWPTKGARNIAMRADNRNGLSWVEAAKSQAPSASRAPRALNLLRLANQAGVIPVYVRSRRHIIADGRTRRSEPGAGN